MAIPKRSKRVVSSGNAKIGVTRDRVLGDRMAAALTVTDTTGAFLVIDLTLDDTRNLFVDLVQLLGANAAEVSLWWRRLAARRDGRPQPRPKAVAR
jgi:hypothetical protein